MLRLFSVAALAALASGAAAQSSNDYGSVYSRFGLGQRYDVSTSQADMMGVSGVALRSGLYNGLNNPALGADQTVTTFSAGVAVRGVRATGADDQTALATAADLPLIQFGVPLYAGKLGLTASYRPYSRVDYRAVTTGEVETDDGETVGYQINLEGAGGLQRIELGLGGRVSNNLQVGASAAALVGTVEYLQRTEFPDAGVTFFETREARATRMYGFTGTLGAVFTASDLLREDDGLAIGASLTLPTTLQGTRDVTLGSSLDRDTLASEADGTVRLPLVAQAGLSYRRPTFGASADVLYEPWGQFESDFSFGGFDPASGDDLLTDRLRVGAGVDFTPAGNRRNASYWERVSYRLGAYTDRGLVAPTGSDLTTTALTGGIALPTRFTGARIGLGAEVGTRGSLDGILVRDLFWRGTFTLNFGDRWFVRRRLG